MTQGTGQARWQAAWRRNAQGRGLSACLLWPISLLYRLLIAARDRLYAHGVLRVHRLPVPVVVVGNVVVGGAGKTPCTLALVAHLQARGWHPGVISRGHGRRSADSVAHVGAKTSAQDVGDEPLLIHRRSGAPVCVARRRADAGSALLAAHPETDILLCDDGLQHLALGRDLAVAVFDDRGIGNGWLLPAGLLREPWPGRADACSRPHLVLHQRRDGNKAPSLPPSDVPTFEAVRQLALHATGPGGQQVEVSALRGQPLAAVAGIARPEVFFDMLRGCGLTLAQTVALPDHAGDADYEALVRTTRHPLICTEKDAVKLFALLPPGAPLQAWSVPLDLSIDPAFFQAIDSHLARLSSRHGHQTA